MILPIICIAAAIALGVWLGCRERRSIPDEEDEMHHQWLRRERERRKTQLEDEE